MYDALYIQNEVNFFKGRVLYAQNDLKTYVKCL